MCEKRISKIKKGSHMSRLRETRRTQRLQRLLSPLGTERLPSPDALVPYTPPQMPPRPVDKNAQCQLILELAWKTINLMQKNSLIQQKIVALQEETSQFVASVMTNPENIERYTEQVRMFRQQQSLALQQVAALNFQIKLEPRV